MFEKGQKIHLIGIKGVGMTALAQILAARGCKVTGSDGADEFFTDEVLKRLKIPVAQPFAANNIPVGTDLIISSVAYYFPVRSNDRQGSASNGAGDGNIRDNPEVAEALKRNLKIITYPQALGELSKQYQVIAVAGSHGKSTTTAMLGWILEKVGFEPNVIVGTKVNKWESNARTGKGPFLVIEADEYRDAFLNYKPFGAIITSIDYDHPDYFKTPAAYSESFKKLVDNIDPKGFLVIEGDNRETKMLYAYAVKRGMKVLSYGFAAENKMCRLEDKGIGYSPAGDHAKSKNVSQLFHVLFYGKEIAASIPFPGKQYVLNSGAAIVAAIMAGASAEESAKALADFPGTARRLEVVKNTKDYIIIDDYAHHPTAITITLEGIKALYPDRKIICVFQPHMFSRTQALLSEFAKCFTPADEVGIMEIFPSARETPIPEPAGAVRGRHLAPMLFGVNGEVLSRETKKFHSHVEYLVDVKSGKQFVKQFLKDGNVIVLMGAGDVYKIAEF